MVYDKFVQIGRVCRVNYGEDANRLCVIVDVLNHSTMLVDGPKKLTGVGRKKVPLRWLSLTEFVLPNLAPSASSKVVREAFAKEGIAAKFAATPSGRRIAQQTRRAVLTDFERFQVSSLKKKRNRAVRLEMFKMKKAAVKK